MIRAWPAGWPTGHGGPGPACRPGAHVEQGRGDGRLGKPVGVQQPGPGRRPQGGPAVGGIRHLAAGDHQPDAAQPLVVRLGEREQLVPVGGRQVDDGDPLALHVAEQVRGRDGARRRQHQRGPAGQRDEHLLDRGVEGQGGELRYPVPGRIWYSAAISPITQARAAVADRDRLGLAGGPRGVDDVSDVVRVQADLGRGAGWRREFAASAVERQQPGRAGGKRASARSVRIATGRAWAHIRASRAGGSDGSSGRYPPPAFMIASRPRIASTPRSRWTPITVSGPAPAGQVAGQPVRRLVELAVGQPVPAAMTAVASGPGSPARRTSRGRRTGPRRPAGPPAACAPPVAGPPAATARTLAGAMSCHAAAMASRQARLDIAADCRRQPAWQGGIRLP